MLTNPKLYFKERITGNFKILVNGKDYTPEYMATSFEDKDTSRLNWDGKTFKIQGGEYGLYSIVFGIDPKKLYEITNDDYFLKDNETKYIEFQYINTNWWNITKMQLSVEMAKQENDYLLDINVLYSEVNQTNKMKFKSMPTTYQQLYYSDLKNEKRHFVYFGI